MTDLVERLRGHDHRTGGDGRSIWAEAADEIRRLQTMQAILEEEIERLHNTYSAEIDRLRTFFNEAVATLEKRNAEIKRLQAAARPIGLDTISEIVDEYCQEIVKTRCQQAAVRATLERLVVRLQAEWNRAVTPGSSL